MPDSSASSATPAAPITLESIELAGDFRAMGEAFGEAYRSETQALCALRLDAATRYAAARGQHVNERDILALAESCLPITQAFDPQGYDEFAGIARGAGVTEATLLAMQGLTDLRDVLSLGPPPDGEGCTSFVVAPDRSATGQLLVGQNWDLEADNMPFIRLVRRRPTTSPETCPETWSLTLTGCLSLIGINAFGIAVGNTNLRMNDARVGVPYLSIIHRALREPSRESAASVIQSAPRAGGHYYYVAGADEVASMIDCSATAHASTVVAAGVAARCNHPLDGDIAARQYEPPAPSSLYRQDRMAALLAGDELLTIGELRSFLADREGGDNRICRDNDPPPVSTNASVIIEPATRTIHACRSQADVGVWRSESLAPAAHP